jgi:hypothetical protein
MANVVNIKRPPGTLAERFWSIAKSAGPAGDDTTDPDPKAIVRHVLRILDALSAGEVGDGVSQSTVSFLALLRQQEATGDMSYASPEQARGETLDERSLVFSVGVLMFEELTGRHPFGAVNNPRRFARIQKGELGSGVQYFPQVPGELRTVLMKAMGPFPEERFASLNELRAHLERFVSGGAKPAPAPKPARLKGLPPSPAEIMFGAAEDNMPTTIHKTLTPSRGVPAQQPKQGTPSRGVPAVTAEVPALSLKKPGGIQMMERLAWLGAGAAIAVGVTLIVLPSRSHTEAPRAAEPLAAAPVAAAPAKPAAPTVTQIAPQKPAAAAPKPAAAAAPAAPVAAAPSRSIEPPSLGSPAAEEGGAFDLNVAGKNAMTVARECFPGLDHSVNFGAGLMFSKEDSVARRVFLSPDEPLTADERKCVKSAMMTTSAGGVPDKNVVADYRFRFKPDAASDKFSFTITK